MPGVFPVRPEPVAILAAGVVTPIGGDLDAFWTGLPTGASGFSTIERFPVGDLRVQRGGEIKKLPSGGESARGCRASRLLCAAADDLRARAPLAADRARIGVVVGTALGGVEALEDAVGGERSLRAAAAGLYDSPAHTLAGRLGARGPVLTVSTACASGASALGLAADLLRADRADLIETSVLKRVLGRRASGVPVNSIKAGMGHTMGAAATLEAIMCLLAARHGAIPHTLGFESGDAECDLDYVPLRPRSARPRVSLSTSLGFGGCNAALVLEGVVA